MAPSRKSKRSRRTKRKSRRTSRKASKKQRGGAEVVLNCTLGTDNKIQVTPPAGVTVDTSKPTILTVNSTAAVNNIKFAGAGGKAVDPRYLGTGTGISIQQGASTLVPTSFTAVRALVGAQKRLNAATPAAAGTGMMIKNLNTSTLGLTATDRKFTITLTTV